ncbi:MAG: SIMPL domain-containing protein [Candidatus Yonathbacteria bacterium]|nr:SIMPL domain-containing protein [Candidatus Yonathbacteria bacterium]
MEDNKSSWPSLRPGRELASSEPAGSKLFKSLTVLAMIGVVLVGAKIITEVKGYRFIGGGVSATNTISVSGDGEVFASPDIATLSFTVRDESKKVADAQDKVSAKVKVALMGIRKLGVADKDIKTENYSSYPKYEWQEPTAGCMALNCPPARPGKQVVVGYEVSQTVTVKVHNLELVNSLVDGLANAGVTEMQGPNFAIDKEDDLKAEARKQAIDKARAKAEVLARDLGVTLVRIVSFSEGQNYPIYARSMSASVGMEKAYIASAPELPKGQQKITSNVTVTYEIR